ncbi:malonyl-CoA decarboxylase domain-containing protein [Cupriavidus gilardii]|uniref:malonyl-CoA decarboxylase domain-containing protein n=1 Tax=Cupriavidus gilardii TaxID=82541 RepID=UPI001580F57A|nr:malonyl-CoA decarboxylase family protein [Cupriavidus gilardii]MCT9071061.1 malonyl-CoA decarboxylase [Cupriavidus gilardii]QKS62832.1 malonyl-CoA decarboxylase family protein [Cupriavidus gilardii]
MTSFETGDKTVSAPLGASETLGDARPDTAGGTLLARFGRWWNRKGGPAEAAAANDGKARAAEPATLSARVQRRQREELRLCFDARLTDGAANAAAQAWRNEYEAAGEPTRQAMLTLLAEVAGSGAQGGGDGAAADEGGKAGRNGSGLSHALSSARIRFFKRLAGLHGPSAKSVCGLHFIIHLRADMLRWYKKIPGLRALDEDLEGLLSNWFDVGLLELQRITWDSPASLLEKLIRYEAVHEIASWADLRNRLDSDRRCYAFFHPRIPREPLIFVEVAFVPEMAANVQSLLDEAAPQEDLRRVKWAIFYSISNTQPGLRGVSFGNFLLKRVIEELQREFPKVKQFATLSPIPGFADWLRKQDGDTVAKVLGGKCMQRWGARAPATGETTPPAVPATGAEWLAALSAGSDDALVRDSGLALAAHFLVHARNGALPADPVARFHLGNGACVERLNWGADLSSKGRAQSCGMMVNYLYVPEALDDNLAKLGEGNPRISRSVAKLLARS